MQNLKDGEYDEGESHAGFLEALNAWRNCKPDEKSTPAAKKTGKGLDIKDVQQSWKY